MVAHDPGGANILAAVAPLLWRAHHQLSWCAGGPTVGLWTDLGLPVIAISDDGGLNEEFTSRSPDLIVTGTSAVSDLERSAWVAARRNNVASLAVIDAWMNYLRRLTMTLTGQTVLPDAIAVADGPMQRGLAAEGINPDRVYEVGQPHLEALVNRLGPQRASRLHNERPLLVFFSEGILEQASFGCLPGYNQFAVMSQLLRMLRPPFDLELAVMPHPLEGFELWNSFLASVNPPDRVMLSLGGRDRDHALCAANGVIGMTSMVLVEATLLGVPVLSLQPERTENSNPILDEFPDIAVVTEFVNLSAALNRFLTTLDQPFEVPKFTVVAGAAARLANAIESELSFNNAGRLDAAQAPR